MKARTREREKGAVLVLVAVLIPVIFAALGLVIDNGGAYDVKRRLQKAVDAGAIAAAQDMRRGKGETALRAAALDGTARNGFSGSSAQVDVYIPPVSGSRKGQAGFVEVVARTDAPLYFMNAIYEGEHTVQARAIAGAVPSPMCVLALNHTASGALTVSGSAAVDINGCAVQVNSASSSAATASGSSYIRASHFDVVGDYTGSGFVPTPYSGAVIMDDPFATLAAPSTSGGCTRNNLNVTSDMTLSPGKYCNGIQIQAGATVTLNPGTYVITGGLDVRGGATLKGEGVTIYNTGSPYQPINLNGSATIQLTAPTSGPYQGILLFNDRNITSDRTNVITGNSASYFTGALYFPSTPVTYIGTADMQMQKMMLVADTVEFQGNVQAQAMAVEDGASPLSLVPTLVY